MTHLVTATSLIKAYGLTNVVFFPQHPIHGSADGPQPTSLLSSVGLPHSAIFTSKTDLEHMYEFGFNPTTLAGLLGHLGRPFPYETRAWWPLGYLFTSLIAVDPESGRVYSFPESEEHYILLHRDVESLLFALIELRKLEVDHDNNVAPEELSERFRRVVGAFDPTPFADEESQWNLSLEELEHGIW
ncbi:SUKH-4 family immunity protein [Streptomyces sp. NPDC048191]|uniref:SUKH-4 family immunity protein n=1 Tax=Streptomyces sp. NPDC048191 TaxID=3155484 RepID=UPI0033F5BDB6